jgi:hypothetical protein
MPPFFTSAREKQTRAFIARLASTPVVKSLNNIAQVNAFVDQLLTQAKAARLTPSQFARVFETAFHMKKARRRQVQASSPVYSPSILQRLPRVNHLPVNNNTRYYMNLSKRTGLSVNMLRRKNALRSTPGPVPRNSKTGRPLTLQERLNRLKQR